jgi:carboxypeptidase T
MHWVFFIFFLAFLSTATSFAHEKGEIFIVEIEAKDVIERSRIAHILHIDSVVDDRIFSVINNVDLENLTKNNVGIISIETIFDQDDIDSYYQPFISIADFPEPDARFHNFDEMTAALRALEQAHPNLVDLFSIGKSIQDRDIWAIRISDDREANPNKKAIVYMGTHHAREHVSTEIALMFAEELLDSVATDVGIADLLKKIEIFVIPVVNPDGAEYDISSGSYKWWRKNRRRNTNGTYGVDLNRNYSYGWGTGGSSTNPGSDIYMGRSPFSEPETLALKNFFQAHRNVTIALTLHTFSELILYPWGGQYDGIGGPDEALFVKMAQAMAAMNNYRPMQSSDLYIASGDTCDYLYGELKIFCFTFELSPSSMLGGGFYPGAGILDRVFDANFEPMMYLANLAEDPRRALADDEESGSSN